ncbi:MAG: LytTR family DNA-binding domain-containing protein [Chitinophagaceae bacterium]
MIKAIIIDDEEHCLETLSLQLKQFCPGVTVAEQCPSARQGIDAIQKYTPDLVFLDIEMPGMNGFELLEQLPRIDFSIVFTTSYDQYAIKAIRFSALDYLLKPVDPKDLVAAVQKIQQQKQLPLAEQFQLLLAQLKGNRGQLTKTALPTAEGFELVPADEIMHCEASDNYTHIFLKNKKKITACRTLKEIEEQLMDFPHFLRVHHSFMVNLNEVTRYVRGEGGYLIMSDGNTISVSRSRKEALLKRF